MTTENRRVSIVELLDWVAEHGWSDRVFQAHVMDWVVDRGLQEDLMEYLETIEGDS